MLIVLMAMTAIARVHSIHIRPSGRNPQTVQVNRFGLLGWQWAIRTCDCVFFCSLTSFRSLLPLQFLYKVVVVNIVILQIRIVFRCEWAINYDRTSLVRLIKILHYWVISSRSLKSQCRSLLNGIVSSLQTWREKLQYKSLKHYGVSFIISPQQ